MEEDTVFSGSCNNYIIPTMIFIFILQTTQIVQLIFSYNICLSLAEKKSINLFVCLSLAHKLINNEKEKFHTTFAASVSLSSYAINYSRPNECNCR